jgi:hypothetical protein
MSTLISDDIVDKFAVVAEPDEVATRLLQRFADVVARISFYFPFSGDRDRWVRAVRTLKGTGSR